MVSDMPKIPKRFKIYYVASGFGLAKDADILMRNLTALGCECQIVKLDPANLRYSFSYKLLIDFICRFNLVFLYRKIQRAFMRRPSIVSIHLEKVFPEKLFLNETHVLIPNQEWFDVSNIILLQSLDAVWCKSRIATNTFQELHGNVRYMGFCSDIGNLKYRKDKNKNYFFSRIGRSQYRGGDLLIEVWSKHPEWPTLKIVMHPDRRPLLCPDNVECIDVMIDPAAFAELSSSSQFHIYLSETEGFGHTIVEALGYGATVIVADAPPMNEVANSECAFMVDTQYEGHKRLATRFSAIPYSLEQVINQVLLLDAQLLEQKTVAAREQYQKLEQEFQKNLAYAVQSI